MINPDIQITQLMEGHRVIKERVPGTAIQTKDVLYFRGDKVLALLRQRLDNLNEISEALKKVVEKHRDRQAAFRNVALGYVSAERALIGEHTSNFRKDLAELWAKVETEINPKLSEPLTKADVYAHYLEDEA